MASGHCLVARLSTPVNRRSRPSLSRSWPTSTSRPSASRQIVPDYSRMARRLVGRACRLGLCSSSRRPRRRVIASRWAWASRRERTIRTRDRRRILALPLALVNPLKDHLKRVKDLHEKELAEGFGKVYSPYALEKKYPNAAAEWMWQYVLPATKHCPACQNAVRHLPSTI